MDNGFLKLGYWDIRPPLPGPYISSGPDHISSGPDHILSGQYIIHGHCHLIHGKSVIFVTYDKDRIAGTRNLLCCPDQIIPTIRSRPHIIRSGPHVIRSGPHIIRSRPHTILSGLDSGYEESTMLSGPDNTHYAVRTKS